MKQQLLSLFLGLVTIFFGIIVSYLLIRKQMNTNLNIFSTKHSINFYNKLINTSQLNSTSSLIRKNEIKTSLISPSQTTIKTPQIMSNMEQRVEIRHQNEKSNTDIRLQMDQMKSADIFLSNSNKNAAIVNKNNSDLLSESYSTMVYKK